MTDLARKILDELMGPDRNKLPSERGATGIRYSDPNVCRHYLIDFCPHLQFLNTKSDIGPCPKKYHEDLLREKFTKEGQRDRETYEREFLDYLEQLVGDLEKRLRRGRERLVVRTDDPSVGVNPENDAAEEKRALLDLQIREALQKIEMLGERGEIQAAQELSSQVELWRAEVDRLKNIQADNPLYRLEKRMELCNTCGAFLIVGDAPKRIEAHFEGRQHNGWARVRQALDDYRKKYPDQHGRRRVGRSKSPSRYNDDRRRDHYNSRESSYNNYKRHDDRGSNRPSSYGGRMEAVHGRRP